MKAKDVGKRNLKVQVLSPVDVELIRVMTRFPQAS